MAGTNLNFPYDAEIFDYQWKQTPDVVLTTLINSGAVVQDSEIANLISNGSNYFTVPFYDVLGGTEQNYDGTTDFTYDSLTGGNYSGAVYGRMKAWKAISFIRDFNSGADPMAQIVSGVAQYWIKKRQARLIGILDAVFAVTGDADFATHITNIATATTTTTDANRIGETTIADACVKACGDNAQGFSIAIMHSVVANRLANLQLLNYRKYTDPMGIERQLPIADINGLTVIVNDNVPKTANATDTDEFDYTTYVLGLGSIRYASAPVDRPSEMDRNPAVAGGTDMIYTRVRETFAPAGFSFIGDVTTDVSVPDTELFDKASWVRKMPAKSIMLAKVVTNG